MAFQEDVSCTSHIALRQNYFPHCKGYVDIFALVFQEDLCYTSQDNRQELI